MSLKTELQELVITADSEELLRLIEQHDQLIRGITQAQNTRYVVEATGSSSIEQKGEAWCAVTSNVPWWSLDTFLATLETLGMSGEIGVYDINWK